MTNGNEVDLGGINIDRRYDGDLTGNQGGFGEIRQRHHVSMGPRFGQRDLDFESARGPRYGVRDLDSEGMRGPKFGTRNLDDPMQGYRGPRYGERDLDVEGVRGPRYGYRDLDTYDGPKSLYGKPPGMGGIGYNGRSGLTKGDLEYNGDFEYEGDYEGHLSLGDIETQDYVHQHEPELEMTQDIELGPEMETMEEIEVQAEIEDAGETEY